MQSASAQALTSAQVRAKAAANESGTCSKLVPAANVEHVVPVGCPVFNLSQATSYAAYFVVEGLGLTFVTHGEPPLSAAPFAWQFITADNAAPRGRRRGWLCYERRLRALRDEHEKRLGVFRRRRGG